MEDKNLPPESEILKLLGVDVVVDMVGIPHTVYVGRPGHPWAQGPSDEDGRVKLHFGPVRATLAWIRDNLYTDQPLTREKILVGREAWKKAGADRRMCSWVCVVKKGEETYTSVINLGQKAPPLLMEWHCSDGGMPQLEGL